MCVEIFHMMNIDVPAGVGVLQHLTHNYVPNCFSNTPYMDSLACPPGFYTVYYTVNSRKVGGGLQPWKKKQLRKNLGLSYKVGMQCFIYMDSQLGSQMWNTFKLTVHCEIHVHNILKLFIHYCSDDSTEEANYKE